MPLFSTDQAAAYFNTEYYDALDLESRDFGQQLYDKKETEIAQREQIKMSGGKMSSRTTYVILGLAGVGLITLAVLKKKGIL